MAQLVKFNSAQVLKNAGVQLPALNGQMVVVTGKDLTKAAPGAWTYNGTIAEFLGGASVANSGTCDVTKLDKAFTYEVFYFLTMKDHQVKSTVTLTLELPNGIIINNNVDLTVKPNEWQAVSLGKFMNTFSAGNIKFSFDGVSGDTWKGLLIGEVMITRV